MSTTHGAGDGAREVHARLVAARLRRLAASGASKDELLAALEAAPAHEEAWRKGADGEARVGAMFDDWAEMSGFGVLHDLSIPGSGANIDHVIVGSGGVLVVDTKAWTGNVRVTPTGLRVGGWKKTKELAGVTDQVQLVRDALGVAGCSVMVRGALCLANSKGPSGGPTTVDGVTVGSPSAIAGVAAQGRGTAPEVAEATLRVLVSHFRPRGIRPVRPLDLDRPRVRDEARPRGRSRLRVRGVGRARRVLWRFSAATVLICVGAALISATKREPLAEAEIRAMVPALTERASAAADGAISMSSMKITKKRAHIRFERDACRVRVSLNREIATSPADAVIVTSGPC